MSDGNNKINLNVRTNVDLRMIIIAVAKNRTGYSRGNECELL